MTQEPNYRQINEEKKKRKTQRKTNPPAGSHQMLRIPNLPTSRREVRILQEPWKSFLLDSAVGYRHWRTPHLTQLFQTPALATRELEENGIFLPTLPANSGL